MSNSKRASEDNRSKKYNDYSLQFSRWFLKSIGAWPQISAPSLRCKIMILLQIFICSSIIAVTTVPCFFYVLFEAENMKKKLSSLGPFINRFMSTMHYWVLLKRSNDIHKLIQHMEKDWSLVQKIDHEVMLQHAKFGRFVTVICGIMMQGACLLFGLLQSIKTVNIVIGNETFTSHPQTCPIYSKIIDTRFTPLNEIALVLQNLVILVISFCTAGGCSLAAVFAIHACGQLNVLYVWLHKLVENQTEKNDKAEQKLAAIVEHHLRILSFVSQLESIMHKPAFVELTGCTAILCLLGYYTATSWETLDKTRLTSYLFPYLSTSFNIFIFCYIGGIVTEQCKLVGEMAYMTNWYNLHHTTARGLILIIARSNNVVKITAGKLFHLSIATFGDEVLAYPENNI
ncbi:PREDICTED: odorant receptor 82a-like [Trachymyrmex septentrionalis]|uniref:odorant receptor 82a-like n=1 Tax=Trachymyrmex septentrionalis TaxID=34720 RepID=UPI00084EE102|nr:PREDICTED: odorant receptor 82a-like [Trachymyrmex septentrionalis]